MSIFVPPFGSGQIVRLLVALVSRISRWFGVVLLFAAVASAQTPSAQSNIIQHPVETSQHDNIYFPGSVWSSTANHPVPSEWDLVSSTHVDQGVAYHGAEVFGTFTGIIDTHRIDWNRRTIEGIGVRFTQNVSHGIVRAGVQYLREDRYVVPRSFTGFSPFIEAWLGWGQGHQ